MQAVVGFTIFTTFYSSLGSGTPTTWRFFISRFSCIVHMYIRMHMHIRLYTRTHIHIYVYDIHICKYIHTHTYICAHTGIHVCIYNLCIHVINTCTHIFANVNTYIYMSKYDLIEGHKFFVHTGNVKTLHTHIYNLDTI